MAFALPAGFVGRRWGELRAMRGGALLLAAALVATPFLPPAWLVAGMALAGVGWALVLVPGYPLVANQGDRDRVGFFTGLYYLFGSGAAILAPGTAGALMDALGNAALFATAAAALGVGVVVLSWARRRGVGGGARDAGAVDAPP